MGLLILLCGFQSISAYGQVVATWTDSNGNWSNAANWSSNPSVPNNGGGTTYSVTISGSNSAVTMDVLNDTIDNLTLGATSSLNISSGNTLGLVSGDSFNYGSLANSGTFYYGANLNNYGALNNTSGANLNNGNLNNYGTLNNSGTLIDGVVTNYGTLSNANGGTIFINDNWYNFGAITNHGQLENDGSIFNHGTLTNYGTLTALNESSTFNYGVLVNHGTIVMTQNLNNFSGGTVNNYGTLTTDGPFGNIDNAGTLNNYGTLTNGTGPSEGTIYPLLNNSGILN
jgi:hypothetical protein